MNIAQIEENLQNLTKSFNKDNFIFDLLLAYGSPKASISRLQNGNLNLSKVEGEISWKKKVFFKSVETSNLQTEIAELVKQLKHDQRFAMVTDFKTLLAVDTKTQDKLDIELTELPKHFDFFLPWAGMEKTQHQNENPADVKAAGKMAKLFDEIKKDNPDNSPEYVHGLNVFLSRLLFCFFAEDTNIFKDSQFTNAIASHTQADGSDLNSYLDKLFEVLNTPEKDRRTVSGAELPAYLQAFPFVNGGLFGQKFKTPTFSRRSRQAIIDSGELQWKEINPDIFGSMFQAVVSVDQRGNLGQHYTSVPNIMKVIEPLFLNDLYEVFENAKGNEKKLNLLLIRISKIKIFDPACGSGNFLIIAYKELRRLEMKIFIEIENITKTKSTKYSEVKLSNFYGIEIDDFAHEVAQLSLWLAEHQMNVEFLNQFGRTNPTLPLREAGKITQGNACRLDWEKVCPKNDGDEIYILGNPPYLGARLQHEKQKSDMAFVFGKIKGFNNLDYISSWILKGAQYLYNHNTHCSFVTTNSICQGEQVALLWSNILDKTEISFAYPSFKWTNNAKSNAGVTVSIIGLRNKGTKPKYIFNKGLIHRVENINGYLVNATNKSIDKQSKSISHLPEMCFGNMANDGGYLFLTENEKDTLIRDYPESAFLIKKLVGALEFIRGENKYCLWIEDFDLELAYSIPTIATRIESCKKNRIASKRGATNELADIPHKFAEIRYKKTNSIIVPRVSSENRDYIPMGFLNSDFIISDSALALYDAQPWILSILSSRIHMTWVRAIGGKLEERIRYSISLCYNTFPFPKITEIQKQELSQCTFHILEEREKHSEKTLAELYDPDKMPEGLREAHRLNDLAVERCYRSKPFESDEERLEYLFKLYEQMIEEEKNKDSLFAAEKKVKKERKKK